MANGKKRGLLARALGVGKNKPKRTITGGYAPDKRSQGQKHGEAAKKKRLQAQEQKRHTDLLTNYGKGTPKPGGKVEGPKNQPKSKASEAPAVKRDKVKTVSEIKAKEGASNKATASSPAVKKNALKFKETRRQKRAKKLSEKADKGAASGSITKRKYDRLNKRAVRKTQREAGTRRTIAGTALAGAKRFAQNLGATQTGAQMKSYKKLGYKKPNPAKLAPASNSLKVQNKAADQK